MFANRCYQWNMFNIEPKFRVKNVKGENDVRKQTHIPYISHQVIINVPFGART